MSGRRGPIIAGFVLIVLGGLFLAREFVPGFELGSVWPIVSIAIGIVLMILSVRRRMPPAT
jgi:hypothetical protein